MTGLGSSNSHSTFASNQLTCTNQGGLSGPPFYFAKRADNQAAVESNHGKVLISACHSASKALSNEYQHQAKSQAHTHHANFALKPRKGAP